MDKREKKFRELWKQAYIDYKDTMHFHHSKDDIDLANHDRCQFEDVAKKVFGYSQKRIDLNETRWDVEWKKIAIGGKDKLWQIEKLSRKRQD